jgi:hypothetical protein
MPIEISVRSNLKQVIKNLSDAAYRQIPFATASALTQLAKEVQADEVENLKKTFKNPKPFTLRSVGVQAARKDSLAAKVFVRPIAARYLQPYEDGGKHELPGKALLNPKDVRLDQYGQLPQRMLQRLKARTDVFIGPVKTKDGIVNGVWQRPYIRQSQSVRGVSKKQGRLPRGANTTGKLKLLIRFGDALPVNKHLNYRSRAQALVGRRFNAVFGAALARAVATAR